MRLVVVRPLVLLLAGLGLAAPLVFILHSAGATGTPEIAPTSVPTTSPGAVGALSVTVERVGGDQPLAGACFAVFPADQANGDSGNAVAGACSDAAGVASIRGVPEGNFVLVQTSAPPGDRAASSTTTFAIFSGETTEVIVENFPLGAISFTATGTSEDGAYGVLPGACVEVYTVALGRPDERVARACDNDDGADDGVTWVRHLEPREYVIVESSAPPGYLPVTDTPMTLRPGSSMGVAADHEPIPVPATTTP